MREIREFIKRRPHGENLVLCTLVRKEGSSYRQTGAKKIIAEDGSAYGLLSGGCLEASIVKAARERFHELPFIERFDMLADEDRLLGYQTGCQGAIEILFERLPAGADLDLYIPFGANARAGGVRISLQTETLGARTFAESADSPTDFFDPWITPVELVLIGCGADADAYAPLAQTMGWNIRYLDYRRDLVDKNRFHYGEAVHAPLGQLTRQVPQGSRVAVVLMTHNYEADLEILRQLNEYHIGYLGCLGPSRRFERLRKDLLSLHGVRLSESLCAVARAPAGVLTHGHSPEEIALSVVTQIQGELVEAAQTRVWTLILAAGASKRFGGPKALAQLEGRSFISRALHTAYEFSREKTLVVTGAYAAKLLPELQGAPSIHNPDWSEGMGTSIAAGLREILKRDAKAEAIMILPVDQPLITAPHLRALAAAGRASQRCALTANDVTFGPPAFIPARFFALAESMKADHGLKSLLRPFEYVGVESDSALRDIDHPQELELLNGIDLSFRNPV